ncbi:MAG TPA: RNA polymerase sigma factor [Sandaracinaceae bacterium LLY-WYZ-13_1]|nr:RNA polymerase sigma factor [Sandaracinaceae bacterium LLY-WYZ-13_1]
MSYTRAAVVAPATRPSRAQEQAWVEAAAEGDARAFRRIVEQHHRSLYLMAHRMVGSAAEAQDLVQDSLAKAYTNLDRFDPKYRLSTWLHRITLNTCRDHLKSARQRERASGADPVPERPDTALGPDEQLARKQRAQRVRAALDQLKDSYREALVLKDLQGLSYAEMKEITGSPITALKIRVVRARTKLRKVLEAMP